MRFAHSHQNCPYWRALRCTLSSALLIMASSMLNAQPLTRLLGAVDDRRFAVLADSGPQRVGNAALVRVATISSAANVPYSIVEQVLIACDGSWIGDAVQWAFVDGDVIDQSNALDLVKGQDHLIPITPVTVSEIGDSTMPYARPLSRQAPMICKANAKEPRNLYIPIALTKMVDGIAETVAMLTGNLERRGNRIDIWIRYSKYKNELVIGKDGQPAILNGKPQLLPKLTGDHMLQRQSIDCNARAMRSFETVQYKATSSTPTSESASRDGPLSTTVPNSIGEAIIDFACRIYGR